jgi:hypothetical protein
VTTGLFLQSLNNVIDLHESRLAWMEARVPEVILLLLFVIAIVGLGLVGYGCGAVNRRYLATTTLTSMLILAVIMLIFDLDQPGRGLIRVNQHSTLRLRDAMKR